MLNLLKFFAVYDSINRSGVSWGHQDLLKNITTLSDFVPDVVFLEPG